jgi:hypothetical protein
MLESIVSYTEQYAVLIPVIVGVVSVAKKAGLSTRYAPILALVLGSIGGYFYIQPGTIGVLVGVTMGLAASGAYSSVKTTLESK